MYIFDGYGAGFFPRKPEYVYDETASKPDRRTTCTLLLCWINASCRSVSHGLKKNSDGRPGATVPYVSKSCNLLRKKQKTKKKPKKTKQIKNKKTFATFGLHDQPYFHTNFVEKKNTIKFYRQFTTDVNALLATYFLFHTLTDRRK